MSKATNTRFYENTITENSPTDSGDGDADDDGPKHPPKELVLDDNTSNVDVPILLGLRQSD